MGAVFLCIAINITKENPVVRESLNYGVCYGVTVISAV